MRDFCNFISQFCNLILNTKVNIIPDFAWYCTKCGPYTEIHFEMGNELANDDADFRAYLESLSPIAKEFSDLTLTLVHECGHLALWEEQSTPASVQAYKKAVRECSDIEYYAIPQEHDASIWGLNWLQNHIEVAKKFEKELAISR